MSDKDAILIAHELKNIEIIRTSLTVHRLRETPDMLVVSATKLTTMKPGDIFKCYTEGIYEVVGKHPARQDWWVVRRLDLEENEIT